MKCRWSARNRGKSRERPGSSGESRFSGRGVPPLDSTEYKRSLDENTIAPDELHVPPMPSGASHSTTGGAGGLMPAIFNFPAAKKPSFEPSGDQKGRHPASLPGMR